MLKKAISFGLIGVFSVTLLAACGQPSDKVEPTVTREAVVMPPPSTPAAATTGGATEAAPQGGAQQGGPTIDLVDIAFEPKEVTIAANQDVVVTLVNKGAAAHDFSITDHKNEGLKNLNISIALEPGETKTVTINAPAGDYYFFCNVPGHEAAGMFGTLHVVEGAAAPSTGAATSAAGGEAAAGAATGGETNLTLNAIDIAWDPKELTGPADQEFTITITNKGAAQHDFSIPDLNITTELLNPGQSVTVTVKAPAGTYQYICTVPGHKEAGMVGTLTLVAGGGAATAGEATAATESGASAATAATESGTAATTGTTNLELNAIDIAWDPKELTGPADQEFTITITNKGAAQHDFSIPDLNITTELLNPGQSTTVTVKAPAGTYQYICTVPGHKEAGMVGTLTLVAGGGAATTGEATAASESASAVAPSTPASEATAETAATTGGETNLQVNTIDIAFEQKELTGPADQAFTITITNKGAAQHDFSLPDLGITSELLNPGQSTTVTVNAPAGTYQYECTVPGHKEAGMVGTLTLVAGGGAATTGEATAASESASAVAPSTPATEATAASESASAVAPSTPAAEATAQTGAATGGEVNLELNAIDIAWEQKELTGPADQEFTITITNKGAAQHDFSIPDLNITTELLNPGQSTTVTVKAPAGTYQYICTVPGHKEAGMVGTLTLVAGGGAATEASPAASPVASPAASPVASANSIELTANDIFFDQKTLEGAANTDITITITNKGAATHDFSIPELGITSEMINPGQSVTVTVNAPAGTYQYECTVPGHAPAGMVGVLTLK